MDGGGAMDPSVAVRVVAGQRIIIGMSKDQDSLAGSFILNVALEASHGPGDFNRAVMWTAVIWQSWRLIPFVRVELFHPRFRQERLPPKRKEVALFHPTILLMGRMPSRPNPWGIPFLPNCPAGWVYENIKIHPVPLYAPFSGLTGFLILLGIEKKSTDMKGRGWLFASFLILSSSWRFILEFIRGHEPHTIWIGGFTAAQGYAPVVLICSVFAIFRIHKQKVKAEREWFQHRARHENNGIRMSVKFLPGPMAGKERNEADYSACGSPPPFRIS
jgi:hypothetical protein